MAQRLQGGAGKFQERKAVAERSFGRRGAGVGQLDGIAGVIERDAAFLEGMAQLCVIVHVLPERLVTPQFGSVDMTAGKVGNVVARP